MLTTVVVAISEEAIRFMVPFPNWRKWVGVRHRYERHRQF